MELTLDQALQKGIEAHKAGKAKEADRYYTAILRANPKHPDANHNMGVLAVGVGKLEEALPFFKTALEANPDIDQYWLSCISTLIKLGRVTEAKAVLNQAKRNGAKGNGFDQIEKTLAGLEKVTEVNTAFEKPKEPPQKQVQPLIDLYSQGQHKESINLASQLLKQFPNSINLYNITGAAHKALGKLDEAIKSYKKAISINPDFALAYNNLGNALLDQGKLDEAIEAFNKTVSIKPDFTDAYYNLGNAFKDQGKLDEALKAYNRAISLRPNYAEAYHNMGNALREQGELNESVTAYNKALSIKPDYADAFYNMGIAFKDQGKLDEAINAYSKAISLKPNYAEAYNNIINALKGVIFTKPNRALHETIVSLLDKEIHVRPKDIAKAAISLLKLDPDLRKHLQLVNTEVIQNPLDVIQDLIELPLLLKLMCICPLPDLELEGLLTKLRCSILSKIPSLKEASPKFIEFQKALALQCFNNEYIYNHTEDEVKILRLIVISVKKALKKNTQPSPQEILALASYKSLHQYDWCNLLVVVDEIQEVLSCQVAEPNYEEKLKHQIPILEKITDNVSSEVRAQYEESPYPRWVQLRLPLKSISISNLVDRIKLNLHDNKITKVEEPEILIAGCGTGQHSIGTAATFKSSNILAVDLSLSSLAYAKRKTEELAIDNIKYMQADILDLGHLNKKFDIIESGGVLHHMYIPMAGWRALTNCLKPGGLMRIGLYSELARKHIVEMRQEISDAGIGLSNTEMRFFRDMIAKSYKGHHKLITKSNDFYSMSSLRDLLFHVQEHRFTIPQIKDHLDQLGLKFCGFETDQIVSHFKKTNTYKDDPYDLDKWQAYEEANPRTFSRMYNFWCQKVALD